MDGDVLRAVEAAVAAAPVLESAGRERRAAALEQMAAALEGARDAVVAIADSESGLGTARLNGELTRTCFQMRHFSDVLREGSYVEATIDLAADTEMGQRPDLRRMLIPVGPVAVFGASNFPLAFSVPGGDTVSALAAGCPAVVKAHSGHPQTSRLCYEILSDSMAASGFPAGTLGFVSGRDAGIDLVQHPGIQAVGFTGSTTGGRRLFDLAQSRPTPIPFYGELGSLNPFVVTPAAARTNGAEIAAGYVESVTRGFGQFCTKPGLVLLPSGSEGAAFRQALADAATDVSGTRMLTDSIRAAYDEGVDARRRDRTLHELGSPRSGHLVPDIFVVPVRRLHPRHLEECFGPTAILAEYDSTGELLATLAGLDGQLTATVHSADGDEPLLDSIHVAIRSRAGRLVFGGYPTGVAVSWAMQHGGPYPAATSSAHTSVGAHSIRRWLRPLTYQDAPQGVLPPELRDGPAGIPRRVNGSLA